MNSILGTSGEISLLCDQPNIVAYDALEDWQVDSLTSDADQDSKFHSSLGQIDEITAQWLDKLTKEQCAKIKRQRSLFSIPIPEEWVKVWRVIIKEPSLRDSKKASRNGKALGSYTYLFNLWAETCMEKYLDEIDKDLISLMDQGYLYSDIGEILLLKYKDRFWKPRKANTKTTPSQVVNNYLYRKIPMKIARAELTEMALWKINKKSPS